MASVKHWLHAVAGSRTHRDTPTEVHRHEESVEFWSATMTSPSHPGSLELPANLIHTEPSRTASVNDIRRVHGCQDVILNPDCEQMITAILSVMVNSPHRPLPPQYNSSLLHVLESYGSLVACLKHERRSNEIEALAMETTLREWEKERRESRAEVKRLEERIAQFQGVEAIRKAREESTLRDNRYETSDRAIARIRRYRRRRGKSGTGSKLLHQPSITGSRINLLPPSGGERQELRIGHPPTTRDETALSAIISPVQDAPSHELCPAESSVASLPKLLPFPNDTYDVEGSPFLRTQSSSEASSAATVINLQLRLEPAGTTGHGTALPRSSYSKLEKVVGANNASPKVCGLQYRRHSRRQLSFCPGDDSGVRIKDLTAPTERNTQSSSGILIKSVACSAEQSLQSVSPIHGCAQTQGCLERRHGSNYSVTSDDKTEVVGPSAHMSVPEVSAIESLKKVQAAVRTTRQEETGSVRTLNAMAAAVFARRVLQSIPTENNNDSQKTLVVEPTHTLFKNAHDGGSIGNNRAEIRVVYL
ncbi:MAG: hypothetical protein M1840_001638 [Geoglossum simile]|nr:MAG: hypothetical protein M1840_001638 [Geoglossum simile]